MDEIAERIEELEGQQQQLVGCHTALTQELGQIAIQIQRVAGAIEPCKSSVSRQRRSARTVKCRS